MTKVRSVIFPTFADENGVLCVYESGTEVPFIIKRVFAVAAAKGDIRGEHAHKECSQLLVCVHGEIKVNCDDGFFSENHLLKSMGAGLLIPPGIWATEYYQKEDSVLMVMCDRNYDAHDYMREYSQFLEFKKSKVVD